MLKSDPLNERAFDTLGTILLSERGNKMFDRQIELISDLSLEQFEGLLKKAETQRVLRRCLEAFKDTLPRNREDLTQLCESQLSAEQVRVENVLAVLEKVVRAFEHRGYPVMVMKTLDHWPDTGSDIDLLAAGEDFQVCEVLENDFHAIQQPQSWGDRLAHKFNFRIPGLNELVEIHVGCLGQTGEQEHLAAGVLSRRFEDQYWHYSFPVPVVEDRIVIATLQRMYRHYYIRLTDIVNIYQSLVMRNINFENLQVIAEEGSVWPGVATLLMIACQHGVHFGGPSIELPDFVVRAARFNSAGTYVDRNFLRVPLVPEATNLYLQQLAENARSRNLRALARLSLLPVLASAAFVAFRVTGNDKGIW
ncbi:MAG TPA: hypothetical protein VLL05_04955 [Terriglobales bacterium]|nr:hypothetical protein [Terriglobales bacterium]